MKAILMVVIGLALFLAPLWTLSGFAIVPEYRTGTLTDFALPLIMGGTLYGGVLVGILIGRRFHRRSIQGIFLAGMLGAAAAITLALVIAFVQELLSTGRLFTPGQTPALLPVFYVTGGILAALIAAGASLILRGLAASQQR